MWRGSPVRRWVVVGVTGAGLVFCSLGLLVAAVVPPFASADEAEHTAYALAVGHGSLPRLDTPLRTQLPGMPGLPAGCRATAAEARAVVDAHGEELCGVRLGRPLSNFDLVYTANHPPLFYAAEAVPLRVSGALDRPATGFRAARVLNVLFGMGLVVATATLARELLPRRPGVAVGAAGIIGVVGLVVTTAGQVYNDVLAMAAVTGLLAAAAALVRRGPRPGVLLALAVLAPVAAASRASGAVALAAVLPMVAIGAALRARGRPGRRIALGLVAAAGPLAVTAAAVGWFYLRNIHLYGDPTASGRIAEMFPVAPARPSVRHVLGDGDLWWSVYRGLFGRPILVTGWPERAVLGVALLTGLGLVAATIRAALARSRRPPLGASAGGGAEGVGVGAGPGGSARTVPATGWLVWLMIAAHCLLVVATLVGYVSRGGAPFSRYLLPMVPVLAIAVAAAGQAVPLGRRGMPTLAVVVALGGSTLVLVARELAWKQPALARLTLSARLRASWELSGPGDPGFGLALLAGCALVGLVLLASALVRLGDPAVDGGGQLGSAPPGEGAGVAAAGLGVAGGGEQLEDRLGEVVGEGVATSRLPDQPHRTAHGGGLPVEQGAGDLPDGRDVCGDDRDTGGERFQGR